VSQRSPDEDRTQLVKAFEGSGFSLAQLWLSYFALGGSAGQVEVEAYLAGLMPLSAHEHNVLAQAINERLAELPPPPRAPYREPGPDLDEPGTGDDS
jgi:hypothetical protein